MCMAASTYKTDYHAEEPVKGTELSSVQEIIKKWKQMRRKGDILTGTLEIHHAQAYNSALDKHLRSDDGKVDLSRLKIEDVQKAFARTMTDFYVSKAQEHFHLEGELTDFEKKVLLGAYAEETYESLLEAVHKHREEFTPLRYSEEKRQVLMRVRARLHGVAASHIKEEHVEDIIRYTNAHEVLRPEVPATREEALTVLDVLHAAGKVSDEGKADLTSIAARYAEILIQQGKDYLVREKYRDSGKASGDSGEKHEKARSRR